ncbi:hypothetical protein BOTCAL_0092g00010 [Botryotinia calthae]|uniref:Uncharacterized protein n=1 Tax=Botryotinia calthae TaxID=38488 RepID=A0A4Y8D7B0_9HELO|nr:hypothetical protein BOTCAL_0092g00010 [Botryotinia calthae]
MGLCANPTSIPADKAALKASLRRYQLPNAIRNDYLIIDSFTAEICVCMGMASRQMKEQERVLDDKQNIERSENWGATTTEVVLSGELVSHGH